MDILNAPYLGGAHLAGKETLDVEQGDVLSIRTPAGGGWGAPVDDE